MQKFSLQQKLFTSSFLHCKKDQMLPSKVVKIVFDYIFMELMWMKNLVSMWHISLVFIQRTINQIFSVKKVIEEECFVNCND